MFLFFFLVLVLVVTLQLFDHGRLYGFALAEAVMRNECVPPVSLYSQSVGTTSDDAIQNFDSCSWPVSGPSTSAVMSYFLASTC